MELCKEKTEGLEDAKCVKDLAVAQKDASLCLQLSGKYTINSCVGFLLLDNPELMTSDVCEKVEENNIRESCYVKVAINTKDGSLCTSDKITIVDVRDACLTDVAKLTNDKGLCPKITSSSYKQMCEAGEGITVTGGSPTATATPTPTKKPTVQVSGNAMSSSAIADITLRAIYDDYSSPKIGTKGFTSRIYDLGNDLATSAQDATQISRYVSCKDCASKPVFFFSLNGLYSGEFALYGFEATADAKTQCGFFANGGIKTTTNDNVCIVYYGKDDETLNKMGRYFSDKTKSSERCVKIDPALKVNDQDPRSELEIDHCYWLSARVSRDTGACDKISDSAVKDVCIRMVNTLLALK
ncbi:MAG: hypothetical protein V1835_00595 [Candidatus Micrarchaeota archaeon]